MKALWTVDPLPSSAMSSALEEPLIQSNHNATILNTQSPPDSEHGVRDEEEKWEKSYFEVLGICCSSEVALVEGILKQLRGVKEISVIVPTKTVIVLHDSLLISPSQLAQAMNKARLEATIRRQDEGKSKKKWPGKWDIACGVLFLLSLFKFVYQPMEWLAIGSILVGIPKIIWKSIASIKNLTLNINIIVLIAVGGALAQQDFLDGAIIVFLYNMALWLESRASHKAQSVMSSLTSIMPQRAILAETGDTVDVADVTLDSVIAIKAGEVIPIDGVVVEGKCEVDEKTLTGESFPIVKELNSPVWAGTITLNGYISIRTTALAQNCAVARMVNLVEEAQNRKASIQRFIDDCVKWYIPVVVLISACVAVIPTLLHIGNRRHWLQLAMVVLVSACPCALVISTPVTIFCALSMAATQGLLFKGGDYLELLGKVKTIVFDKTGTITTGEFVVTHFQSLHDEISIQDLLFWVSSIESKSSHPMAAALISYAGMHSVEPMPESVMDFKAYPGEGIYGNIDGNHIYIGNHKISLRAGCATAYELDAHNMDGKTSGFVFKGSTLAGSFSLSDECRRGAGEAIKELKDMGIRTALLTGDNHGAAQFVQNQINGALDIVYAELLPEDKAKIIEELQKDGPVAMVGDGINDALGLATSDVGISMGISGSALAVEIGNVILMSNDIKKIPQATQISKRASRKIIENIVISISTKGAILILSIVGYPMVSLAVLTDVGTCMLVIFNSMLLLKSAPSDRKIESNGGCCAKSTQKTNSNCCETANIVQNVTNCRNGCCGSAEASEVPTALDDKKRVENVCCSTSSSCCRPKNTRLRKCCSSKDDTAMGNSLSEVVIG